MYRNNKNNKAKSIYFNESKILVTQGQGWEMFFFLFVKNVGTTLQMKCANMLSLPKKKKMYMFFHFQIELRYLVNVVAFQFQRLLNFRGMYCSTKDMIGVPRIMSQQLSMVIWH